MTEIESIVLEALKKADGAITRPHLISLVYGCQPPKPGELANDRRDRRIRQAITNLRRQGILIVSTSDGRGYRLATTEAEIQAYVNEQISRVVEIQKTVRAIKKAYGLKDQMSFYL